MSVRRENVSPKEEAFILADDPRGYRFRRLIPYTGDHILEGKWFGDVDSAVSAFLSDSGRFNGVEVACLLLPSNDQQNLIGSAIPLSPSRFDGRRLYATAREHAFGKARTALTKALYANPRTVATKSLHAFNFLVSTFPVAEDEESPEPVSAAIPLSVKGPDLAFGETLLEEQAPSSESFFAVPSPDEPEEDSLVILIAYAGRPTLSHITNLYQHLDEYEIYKLVIELNNLIVPFVRSASAGYFLGSNGRMGVHTCSTASGCSGGALLSFQDPHELVGMHVKAPHVERMAAAYNDLACQNYCVSVQHPLFVENYVRHVVPDLSLVAEWPSLTMPQKVAGYMRRHRTLLEERNLWNVAQKFMERQGV